MTAAHISTMVTVRRNGDSNLLNCCTAYEFKRLRNVVDGSLWEYLCGSTGSRRYHRHSTHWLLIAMRCCTHHRNMYRQWKSFNRYLDIAKFFLQMIELNSCWTRWKCTRDQDTSSRFERTLLLWYSQEAHPILWHSDPPDSILRQRQGKSLLNSSIAMHYFCFFFPQGAGCSDPHRFHDCQRRASALHPVPQTHWLPILHRLHQIRPHSVLRGSLRHHLLRLRLHHQGGNLTVFFFFSFFFFFFHEIIDIPGHGMGNRDPSLRYADYCRSTGNAGCHDGRNGVFAGAATQARHFLHISTAHQCLRQAQIDVFRQSQSFFCLLRSQFVKKKSIFVKKRQFFVINKSILVKKKVNFCQKKVH